VEVTVEEQAEIEAALEEGDAVVGAQDSGGGG
jgi:hypothetical protein